MLVFPAPVPPMIMKLILCSSIIQKYAAILSSSVPILMRSTMLNGSFLNFLIQKVLPFMETSFMNVAANLCFSGSMPSMSGVALEMCLEDLWASLTMKSLAVSSSMNVMLVGMLSYFRCQT